MTLAVVLLPPLAAGTGHGAPPTPYEVAALRAVLDPGSEGPRSGSEVVRQFHRAAVGGDALALPADEAGLAALVGRARLLQLLSIAGISALLYLAVLLARGRLQALLACAALAVLPPVAQAGALLRPEAPAALFTGLALLLLQSFAQTASRAPGRRPWRRIASLGGLGLCAVLALGLATAALPSLGASVLLPGLVLTLGAAMLLVRTTRVLRRHGWQRLPHRALNARLLPWTAIALLSPAVVIAVLAAAVAGPIDGLLATPAQVGLLPASTVPRLGAGALMVVGAIAAVLRIGLRFGRGGRIGAELVLLVYCALELVATLGAPPGSDRLPAAPALAVVLAEGARVVVHGIAWLAIGRRRAR
ncbi:MAG: hypothetical protein JNM25_17040 [Planctomycetes bacterium]|nr:hypothetical protein [Planctomycetota bacterium]